MIFSKAAAQTLLLGIFVLIGAAEFPAVAFAHEGGPQLIVDAARMLRGDTVEVRGANLGSDLVIRLELVVNGSVIPLGEALCDGHGDFTQTVVLSEDLPAGTYTLQAVDPSVPGAAVMLASTQLNIRSTGWSWLFENGMLVAVGLLALGAMALGVRWVLRARQREGVARKQPDAHLR